MSDISIINTDFLRDLIPENSNLRCTSLEKYTRIKTHQKNL